MVAAVGDEVVHVELCQVLAVLEGAVVYYHFRPGICISAARCAILEHYLLDVLVTAQGGAVYGDGLVVVRGTDIVVDAHLAIQFIDILIVYTNNLHIPGLLAVACRAEQAVDIKILDFIFPGLEQRFHLGHIVARKLVAKVTIFNTILGVGNCRQAVCMCLYWQNHHQQRCDCNQK